MVTDSLLVCRLLVSFAKLLEAAFVSFLGCSVGTSHSVVLVAREKKLVTSDDSQTRNTD